MKKRFDVIVQQHLCEISMTRESPGWTFSHHHHSPPYCIHVYIHAMCTYTHTKNASLFFCIKHKQNCEKWQMVRSRIKGAHLAK